MSMSDDDVTHLLQQASRGDTGASEALYSRVYEELHRVAEAQMLGAAAGQTLQPTALVSEAWLRLVRGRDQRSYENREHFFSVAARAMRSALVDQARKRSAGKRGGHLGRVSLDVALDAAENRGVDVLALNDALDRLAQTKPRPSQVVEMRFFGGLSLHEIASALDVSQTTVNRDLQLARIWLREELRAEPA